MPKSRNTPERTAYLKEYYLRKRNDPEFIARRKLRARQWALDNPDKVKQNLEVLHSRDKAYRDNPENTERVRQKYREFYYRKRDLLGHTEEYKLRYRLMVHRRRERFNANGETGRISVSDIQDIFKRDNYSCLKCGSLEYLTLDHILPVSKGGISSKDNLQTLCRSCNSSKSTKTMDYRKDFQCSSVIN